MFKNLQIKNQQKAGGVKTNINIHLPEGVPHKIDNSQDDNSSNLSHTFLNATANIQALAYLQTSMYTEEDNRVTKNLGAIIRKQRISQYPIIIADMLASDSMLNKLITLDIGRAFPNDVNIVFSSALQKAMDKGGKKDKYFNQVTMKEDILRYIGNPIDMKHYTTAGNIFRDAVKDAQCYGGCFVVIHNTKDGKLVSLSEKLDMSKPSALDKSAIGKIHFEEIAPILDKTITNYLAATIKNSNEKEVNIRDILRQDYAMLNLTEKEKSILGKSFEKIGNFLGFDKIQNANPETIFTLLDAIDKQHNQSQRELANQWLARENKVKSFSEITKKIKNSAGEMVDAKDAREDLLKNYLLLNVKSTINNGTLYTLQRVHNSRVIFIPSNVRTPANHRDNYINHGFGGSILDGIMTSYLDFRNSVNAVRELLNKSTYYVLNYGNQAGAEYTTVRGTMDAQAEAQHRMVVADAMESARPGSVLLTKDGNYQLTPVSIQMNGAIETCQAMEKRFKESLTNVARDIDGQGSKSFGNGEDINDQIEHNALALRNHFKPYQQMLYILVACNLFGKFLEDNRVTDFDFMYIDYAPIVKASVEDECKQASELRATLEPLLSSGAITNESYIKAFESKFSIFSGGIDIIKDTTLDEDMELDNDN